MTPLARLLAEEVPTGEVPDYQPGAGRAPWTAAEQARHRDDLIAALTGTVDYRARRRATPPPPARSNPPAETCNRR